MHQTIKNTSLLLGCLLCTIPCFASAGPLDNLVFTSQKYIVVTAIVLTIFIGIIIYLFSIERKIKNLEDRQNKIH